MKFRSPFRRFQAATHETRGRNSADAKCRIIIHAGFAKCGNSSIRAALFQNFGKLREHGVSLFGKNLRIARDPTDLDTLIWFFDHARNEGEQLTQKLRDEVASVAGRNIDRAAILSAENLADPKMPPLFAGLDRQFEVSVIFYVRPQLQWIPSAWKQWGLKKGMPLNEFVSHYIDARRPSFRRSIDAWKNTLPDATLHVRFLIPELLAGGNPAQDFFHLLGLPEDKYMIGNEPQNPSLDFSILHVLSKNPHLFSDVHDNKLMEALTCVLPKKFRSTNIQMLSAEQEARIEECFRDENLWLLHTYGGEIDVNHIYRTHFTPHSAKVRYSSMSEIDFVYRCLGIILEALASSNDLTTAVHSRIAQAPKHEDIVSDG